MKPLYAFAALVPAGMLLGFVGGKASHPEMKFHRSQILPASVIEHADRIEPYRPIYEAGPQDLNPRGVSYRPDLDYSFEYYPPQDVAPLPAETWQEADYASAPEPLEANYGDPHVTVHVGSSIDRAAERAAEAAKDAAEAAQVPRPEQIAPAAPDAPHVDRTDPLAFQQVPAIETESF
ncbi:hypothetical protein [Croceibacterium aestuarii]|uniref:hypothetical protein n=1 Tax=Croceibacterium aestuarii TaxID=3064139 RepID=UPI00272E8413|nr:hypothetical protein [Croceibacterium sp. D39]